MTMTKRRDVGFTLVEILIAMAVFLIGVVAIIGVFPEGLRTTSKSVDDTVAGYVVQSVRDAIVDALRRNVVDEEEPGGDTNQAYWVRWFHDGLPATGATFRLARTFPIDAADPTAWGDAAGTRYNMPDYFKGAAAGANLGANWDYTGPNNPNVSMLTAYTAPGSAPTVTLNRGWWFPDMSLSSDDWASVGSLITEANPTGGATSSTRNNEGVEVVRLGTLSGTTADAQNRRDVEFPDPLSMYSFQFICQIFNDLTPGGDNVSNGTGMQTDPSRFIPCTPFPGEYDLIPEPFYPDNPTSLSPATKYQDRIRKDMRPGLAAITFFPFKGWRVGFTGTDATPEQWQRDEAREQNCVRLFQFLASFTQ